MIALAALLALTAVGCAAKKTGDDPLKYTKKLVVEGHSSLYNNGAFEVPNTKIKLIPPGPETTELVAEMMGVRALQSFEKSVNQAAESVTVVSEGTQASYRFAKDIHRGTDAIAKDIHSWTKESSTLVLYKSTDLGKEIIGNSWDTAKHLMRYRPTAGPAVIRAGREAGNRIMDEGSKAGDRMVSGSIESGAAIREQGSKAGDRMVSGSIESGAAIREQGSEAGDKLVSGSLESASSMSRSSIDRSGDALRYGGRKFVKGYAALPKKTKERVEGLGTSLSRMNPVAIVQDHHEFRKEWSGKAVDLVSMTFTNYPADATVSFKKAGKEMSEGYRTTGLSLAMLRSLRWVVQGLLWDATIEPAAKMTAASLGYIGVNFVAFPTMVVVEEGVATTRLALDVTWDTAGTAYDIVAPTAIAAVAGVYGVADLAVSHTAAGITAVGGPALGYGEKAAATVAGAAVSGGGAVLGYGEKAAAGVAGVAVAGGGTVLGYGGKAVTSVAGVTVKAGSYAAGQAVRTVEYIGVPLASAGIALGGGAIGTAVGGVGVTGGGMVFVSGEAASGTTQVFGNVIAGTALAGGTAVSTAGGAAYGVYELSKAVVVPAGYELGGGLVLSYETLSQLSAHTILAVSDCAYMVLSLEGPRWVLYAVKGNTGKGEDLPVGAVVDLKQMQEQGEVIYNLPVSDQEMKKVVETVYGSLPEVDTNEK
jgi:hypothetical protein